MQRVRDAAQSLPKGSWITRGEWGAYEQWYPDQLTIEEAIDAHTRASAWACFEEKDVGTITPGKLADLAVFNRDLIDAARADPARLLEAKADYTIVRGPMVFERRAGL